LTLIKAKGTTSPQDPALDVDEEAGTPAKHSSIHEGNTTSKLPHVKAKGFLHNIPSIAIHSLIDGTGHMLRFC
jgi:hypothetical protein